MSVKNNEAKCKKWQHKKGALRKNIPVAFVRYGPLRKHRFQNILVHINVYECWFRYSEVDKGLIQKQTEFGDVISLIVFPKSNEIGLQ
jgi:hypothetical protein